MRTMFKRSSCTRLALIQGVVFSLAFALGACSKVPESQTPTAGGAASEVSSFVKQFHDGVRKTLKLDDPAAMADATQGLIARPKGQVLAADGRVIWDYDSFDFLKGDSPETVNPSLWRQSILNNQIGLFKVKDGIWQLRGFDLANMTIIQGKSGWIIVDPLTAKETAQAAIAFARQHLGDKPVSAIIYTHSHVDHFGGALGVLSREEVAQRKVPVIAPEGFMEEATSENILMGTAMVRRSQYMYGNLLERSPKGLVDLGLGKAVAYGTVGLLAPNVIVDGHKKQLDVDGLNFTFHNVPASEAPSEFTFYIKDLQAYGGAELLGHTLHNLYTLRGAKVRDALKWTRYLDQALENIEDADVAFNQHNWPVYGHENIKQFIVNERDVYKYIHDQTVRMINQGMTPGEIADELTLPESLSAQFSTRGYYGTVRHNSRAVYQMYMGWFDAHPSNLNPHSPVEAGKRYVEGFGGPDKVMEIGRKAYESGDYRWGAEVLKHLVMAQPDHKAAKQLLAQTMEQMGYMAESAPWRNFYLTGAQELLQGPPEKGLSRDMMLDLLNATPTERFLEAMAASLNGPKAADVNLVINLNFSDVGENWIIEVARGVMNFKQAKPSDTANATLVLTRSFFMKMMMGKAGGIDLLTSDETKIKGSRIDLAKFFSLLDKATGNFAIVTP